MNLINNFFLTLKREGLLKTLKASKNHISSIVLKTFGFNTIIKNIYNYKMILDLYDKGISRTLILFGERELEHKFMLEQVIKPGMRILDIGANIGYYAIMESLLIGKTGNLIAVEPSKSNVNLLKKNLELNNIKNYKIHEGAISNADTNKKFFLSNMSNLNTFHNIGTGKAFLNGETIDVKTYTVKTILKGETLDLMRMDVEGHEVEVLDGLINSIDEMKKLPMIIFETHISRYNTEHNFENTLNKLFNLGYFVGMAGSSSIRGSNAVEKYGYKSIKKIKSDGEIRKIFTNIKNKDAIDLICHKGGLRTVLLKPSI